MLCIAAAGTLARALEIPAGLLRGAGFALVPFVAFVAYVARQRTVARPSVLTIIVLNAAWVLASAWLMIWGGTEPNLMGDIFIVAQALAVALFAEMQYVGLRRRENRA